MPAPLDYLDRVVLPALLRRLDGAFPELGAMRGDWGWVASQPPASLAAHFSGTTSLQADADGLCLPGSRRSLVPWIAYAHGTPARYPFGVAWAAAARRLARAAGVPDEPIDPASEATHRQRDLLAIHWAWTRDLRLDGQARLALAALRDFGFGDAELRSARLPIGVHPGPETGCFPAAPSVRAFLEPCGFAADELGALGLLDAAWTGCLVLPVRDQWQRLVGCRGLDPRRLDAAPSLLAGRAEELAVHGLDVALGRADAHSDLVLVEGALAAVLLQARGIDNVAGVERDAVASEEFWQALAAQGVRGVALRQRPAPLPAAARGMRLRLVTLPAATSLVDLLRRSGPSAVRSHLTPPATSDLPADLPADLRPHPGSGNGTSPPAEAAAPEAPHPEPAARPQPPAVAADRRSPVPPASGLAARLGLVAPTVIVTHRANAEHAATLALQILDERLSATTTDLALWIDRAPPAALDGLAHRQRIAFLDERRLDAPPLAALARETATLFGPAGEGQRCLIGLGAHAAAKGLVAALAEDAHYELVVATAVLDTAGPASPTDAALAVLAPREPATTLELTPLAAAEIAAFFGLQARPRALAARLGELAAEGRRFFRARLERAGRAPQRLVDLTLSDATPRFELGLRASIHVGLPSPAERRARGHPA